MPLSNITAESKEELIAKIIKLEMENGKSKEQAIAIAYAEAKRRGYKDIYSEQIAQFGKASRLNGTLKVPVTLVAEMVQSYHRKEIPFLDKILPEKDEFISIFKPWKSLEYAFNDLKKRGIKQLPFVMPHSDETFLEEQVPFSIKKYVRGFIKESEVVGWVKDFYLDEKAHKLKGFLYLKIADQEEEFLSKVEHGEIIDVSIGFICDWESGGEFNGEDYVMAQTKIQIGHLAGLPHAVGKCPSGICGINQDQSVISAMADIHHNHSKTHLVHFIKSIMSDTENLLDQTDSICNCTKLDLSTPSLSKDGSNGGIIKESSHLNTQGAVNMVTIEELQAQIAELQKENKSLKDSAASTKLADSDSKIKKLEADLAVRDQQIADLQKENESCKSESKKMEDALRADLVPKLQDAFPKGVKGKKIEDMCLHDQQILWASVVEYRDAQIQKKGITTNLPTEGERDAQGKPDEHKDTQTKWGKYEEAK